MGGIQTNGNKIKRAYLMYGIAGAIWHWIQLYFQLFDIETNKYSTFNFELLGDDIIINSTYESIQRVVINLPFSLYYFFFIALIYPKIFKTDLRYIHFYNLALFIIHPLLILTLINGFSWSDNLIRAHEIGYKFSFLALGMYVYSNEQKAI